MFVGAISGVQTICRIIIARPNSRRPWQVGPAVRRRRAAWPWSLGSLTLVLVVHAQVEGGLGISASACLAEKLYGLGGLAVVLVDVLLIV